MPLTGSLSAPSSCLRCQLRQIILSTRLGAPSERRKQRTVQVCHNFSTSLRRYQNHEDNEESVFLKSDGSEDEKTARYRREYPLGRIVGQPGRRQRERSQTLKINSMQRPFDVVLMQDIREPEEQTLPTSNLASQERDEPVVTAAEVSSGLLNHDQAPSQDEVNASIDALRPDASVVEQQEFHNLSRQLAEGYNTQQLSSYLTRARQSSANSAASEQQVAVEPPNGKLSLAVSSWRAGRTPIEKRHATSNAVKNTRGGQGKKRITEQILRSVWNLSLRSEVERIGELEVSLESWQFEYLFEYHEDGKPNYEHVIQSPFLLQRSEVQLHRPDLTMRIAARQRDAEEVVRLLQQDLWQMGSLEVPLTAFRPILGTAEWSKTIANTFLDSKLRHIGQHTKCVIDRRNDGTLHIFGKSKITKKHAQRLILSLLHLPSPTLVDIYSQKDGHYDEFFYVPDSTESSLHYRDRGLALSRLTSPASRSSNAVSSTAIQTTDAEGSNDSDRSRLAAKVVKRFEKLRLWVPHRISKASVHAASLDSGALNKSDPGNVSYWHDVQEPSVMPWQVQICRVLQHGDRSTQLQPTRTSTSRRTAATRKALASIIQADVPGINSLLSYFEPFDEDRYAFDSLPKAPSLVAHFFPSPYAVPGLEAMYTLPRLELWYQAALRDDQQSHGSDSLRLSHVRAILRQEELRALLPTDTVDLRALHKSVLTADLQKAVQDREIELFCETLRQSASSDSGALVGRPSLTARLPAWVTDGKGSRLTMETGSEDVEVDYLFEGFEQVQTAMYHPLQPDHISTLLDPAMEEMLHSMSDSMVLEYKAIEGGIIGGDRGELTLKYKDSILSTQTQSDNKELKKEQREKHIQLLELALSLSDILTKINAGEIRSLQGSAESIEK